MEEHNQMHELLREELFGTPEEQAARKEQAKNEAANILDTIREAVIAEEQPEKKYLEKILQRLSNVSERCADPERLCQISMAMAQVYRALHGRSQSVYADNLSCVAQLPVEDLLSFYAERADNVRRQAGLR